MLGLNFDKSRSQKLSNIVRDVRKARVEQMKYLERILRVKMAYVFNPKSGPGSNDLDDVA